MGVAATVDAAGVMQAWIEGQNYSSTEPYRVHRTVPVLVQPLATVLAPLLVR